MVDEVASLATARKAAEEQNTLPCTQSAKPTSPSFSRPETPSVERRTLAKRRSKKQERKRREHESKRRALQKK